MTKKKKSQLNKFKDFRNFLFYVWRHLRLPSPTQAQYEIAEYLQGDDKRIVIQGFRGIGKSFTTSAFVLHQLLLDPQKNILVVSASKNRADDFSTFCLRLLNEVDILQPLIPTEEQRQSKISFDVRPARASHAPSVKSLGITSQLAGNRADIIVADDCEVVNNSATQGMRDKLSEAVREFEAIIKPTGRIIFLGTPQHEQSLYNQLLQRGYKTRCWTARFPSLNSIASYGDTLAPKIKERVELDHDLVGKPTDTRFDEEDLKERELSYGRAGFALQFMLDTRLSDMDRYPLKVNDLIVMSLNPKEAPEKVIWATSPELRVDNIPNVAMAGDYMYRPMQVQGDFLPYQASVMAIDPAGRGPDETSYAIVKMLNGNLYVHACGGIHGGYEKDVLQKLANLAKEHSVNSVLVESNFGDGMWTKLFTPYIHRTYPTTIEEVRHNTQKEKRILDVLEVLFNQHRLIVDEKVILEDYNSCQDLPPEKALKYQLVYQMTRLTRDRGALKHDDRIDCLAMACQYFVDQMVRDQDKAAADRKEELHQKELDKFMETAIGAKAKENSWINYG